MSFEALELLERRVNEAAERLAAACEESGVLRARVTELEQQLAASGGADSQAWQSEREALRKRVEKLARRLAELLEA